MTAISAVEPRTGEIRQSLELVPCADGCRQQVCARCGHPSPEHYSEHDRKRGAREAPGSCALCFVLRGVSDSCIPGGPP